MIKQILEYEDANIANLMQHSNSCNGVGCNPNTSIQTLIELSKDEFYFNRRCVAVNPNTPIDTLIILCNDKDYYVRDAAKIARINRLSLLK